jgi:hypothetical protein
MWHDVARIVAPRGGVCFARMRSMALVSVDKMEIYRNLKICLPYHFMHPVQS